MATSGEYLCANFLTAAAVTKYRFLEMNGNKTVQHSSSAGLNPIVGVSLGDQATVGAAVAGATRGHVKVTAGGTVTAGQMIRSDNAGKAVAIASTGEDYTYSCGIAVTGGSSGEVIEIEFAPHQASDISVIQ